MFECEIRLYLKVNRMRKSKAINYIVNVIVICETVSVSVFSILCIHSEYWDVLVLLSNEFLLLLLCNFFIHFITFQLFSCSVRLLSWWCVAYNILITKRIARNKWNDRSIFSNTNMRIILFPSTIDCFEFANHTFCAKHDSSRWKNNIIRVIICFHHRRIFDYYTYIHRLLKSKNVETMRMNQKDSFNFSYVVSCQSLASFSNGKSNNKIENSFYR